MFWKRKCETCEWNKITKPPPVNVEVLFCDDDFMWIGRRYEVVTAVDWDFNRRAYLTKDMLSINKEFVFCSQHQHPKYWKYLPRLPERK